LTKQETNLICLLDWATAYLEFAKSKFVQKTWGEKRSMFKCFFLNIETGTPGEDLQPGQVLLFLQNDSNPRYVLKGFNSTGFVTMIS
jgi:hypothetical protein